jgi:hypothetical protein
LWCNTQPWHLHITEGDGTERFRSALSAHAASAEFTPDFPFPARYSGAHLERRRECGFQLYDSVGIDKGYRAASARQAAQNFELFGVPDAAIVTTEAELGVYGAIDCGVVRADPPARRAEPGALAPSLRRRWPRTRRSSGISPACPVTLDRMWRVVRLARPRPSGQRLPDPSGAD